MNLDGIFYGEKKKEYDEKTAKCIVEAVEKLETIENKPLMMLGKIQSGKTRSFIGVTSLAFDNGYDLAIILTKNSNALAQQTVARMRQEFAPFKDDDIVDIYDIMCMPSEMCNYELDKKLIIVVKKEKNNLPKMIDFIEKYSLGNEKKCLIIDDEADFCSIGFEKKKGVEDYDLRKIASQINDLRLSITCRFIQVTATPYALYLQPESIDINSSTEIKPIKPAETVLVPYGDKYIGGDYYFDSEKNSLNEYLFYAITEEELAAIKKPDRRKLKKETVLVNNKVVGLRMAIINFIVGGCIRIIQNGGVARGKKNKFSFIIHTEIAKAAHQNQEEIIIELLEQIKEEVNQDSDLIKEYIRNSYDQFYVAVQEYGFAMPEFEMVKEYFYQAIKKEWVNQSVVNSENDINTLLDDDGQLKLRTPLNIFIGGQILDRGITIANLIGFYYGRAPKKMQQDSVLQHARMYGYRDPKDLSVTKFYTTPALYMKMKQINEIDRQLRKDFEDGNFKNGVVFIGKDTEGKIIPCSPNKIMMSNTHVLKAGSTALPIGFNTKAKTTINRTIIAIDKLVEQYRKEDELTFVMPKEVAIDIIQKIYETLVFEVEDYVTEDELSSLINYLSSGSVNVFYAHDRNTSRTRTTSRYYSDMPYNRDRDLKTAKEIATVEPTLMLMKQNGLIERGWKGAEFYWPVLVVHKDVKAAVYTSDVL